MEVDQPVRQPNFRPGLGDIVTMPLPTEWAPEVQGTGVPQQFVLGAPASAPGGGGPLPPGGTPGAYIPASGLTPGSVTPNGLVIPGTVSSTPGPQQSPTRWEPQPILPDWMLPEALQRSNPLVRRNRWRPNGWDYRLRYEAMLWQWMTEHGGLRSCCRIPALGAPIWEQPPWQVQPSQGIPYRQMFALPIASISGGGPFNGIDTILGQWNVENGYDGIINQFVCGYTGAGFDEFSGNIVWRVRVDNRYAKNLGNVQNTFGSLHAAFLVPGYGIRLVSNQTVTLYANIPAGSPVVGGVVTAGVFGWTYPRR